MEDKHSTKELDRTHPYFLKIHKICNDLHEYWDYFEHFTCV